MTGRTGSNENSSTSWGLRSLSTSRSHSGPSAELEKLLITATETAHTQEFTFNTETMVDELLTSTWEPFVPTVDTHGNLMRNTSFTHQTTSLNAFQSVLTESITRLIQHRKVVSTRIADLEHANRQLSSKFQEELVRPDELLKDICTQMEHLEERYTKINSSVVLIGDELSTLDNQRARVLETDELLEALLVLNDPSNKATKSSNRLFNTLYDPTQLHEASRIIKKMTVISSDLPCPTMSYAVAEIERLSQTIENNLLTEFTNEQEKNNVPGMRKCVETLIEYNDKEKVADRYVWNVMSARLTITARDNSISSIDPIEDLDALYTKVTSVCTEQFPVIDKVFPIGTGASIRELLVERLLNDPAFGILPILDHLFQTRRDSTEDSATSSSLRFVKLLRTAYERTCGMVAEIEAIEYANYSETVVQKASISQEKTIKENNATDHGSAAQPNDRFHTFLDLQLHSLFGNHHQRYLETELDLSQKQFREILTAVDFPNPPVASKTKGGASKVKTNTPATLGTASSSSPSASSTQLVASSSITSISTSSSNFDKDGGLLNVESLNFTFFEKLRSIAEDESVLKQYVEVMNEAIERSRIILAGSELRGELVTQIFTFFVASFGNDYQEKLIALTKEILQEQRLASDSALQFFTVLEVLVRKIDVLNEQFEMHIAPSLKDSPTQLTICFESKQGCLEKLEKSISASLQLALTVIEKSIGQMLVLHQEKEDFLSGKATMSLSSSKACQKCTQYLQPLVDMICRVLMEENRAIFAASLAIAFKELYLTHLQKFRFDPDGACMLLRDVSEYRQVFRSSSLPASSDEVFDLLHEVANVFALPAENLGGYVREGKLATLNKQTLHQIVKRRWDYKINAEKIAASLKDAKDTKN